MSYKKSLPQKKKKKAVNKARKQRLTAYTAVVAISDLAIKLVINHVLIISLPSPP